MIDPFAFCQLYLHEPEAYHPIFDLLIMGLGSCFFILHYLYDSKKVFDCYVFLDQIALYYPNARYQQMPVD